LQRPPLHDQKTFLSQLHHRAVRQLRHRHRRRMQPLPAALQPLAMQHGVDLARANVGHAVALFPAATKAVGIIAAAEEARAMAGGERGGLVEKEQLGPAPAAHHLAPPSPEFADAGDPRRARPALLQQRFRRGVVDDAAVAGEHAAMRGGDDVAGGRDAVLQGQGAAPSAVIASEAKQSRAQHAERWIASSLRSSQ
jgi:hypothetical protein